MTSGIIDNEQASRYEYTADGHTAFANYRREGRILTILYVEAPPGLRGTGAAGRLMEGIAADAKRRNLDIVPVCGYAAAWLRKHKEAPSIDGRSQ